jgi:hypothetical protein
MKNERSSHLLLLFLIGSISILHAIKLREQRFTKSSNMNEHLIVTIPGAASLINPTGFSLSTSQLPSGN